MEALPFPHPLSPGGSQSCWEVSSSQPTFREACSEGEMHQESSAKSAARENFGLIFVCSDYNLSYASSLQRPKGKASVSASADRRQEGEMLEAGCPSRSQGPSPEETGPKTRSGHCLAHRQPLLHRVEAEGHSGAWMVRPHQVIFRIPTGSRSAVAGTGGAVIALSLQRLANCFQEGEAVPQESHGLAPTQTEVTQISSPED